MPESRRQQIRNSLRNLARYSQLAWKTARQQSSAWNQSRWMKTTGRWIIPALVVAIVAVQTWLPHTASGQQRSGSAAPRPAPRVNAAPGQIAPAGFGPNRDGLVAPVAQRALPRAEDPPVIAAAQAGAPVLMPNLDPQQLVSPGGLTSTLNLFLLLTVLSLAPSILMLTTCFVRFVIVFGLLRQALGTQTLPPNQVVIGLSLFLTLTVMAPVWQTAYDEGIRPYTAPLPGEARLSLPEMFQRTVRPLRHFMCEQIDRTNNADAVWMFVEYQRPAPGTVAAETWQEPETYDDVPLTALLPAYLVSELKTSFIIGFQIFLPFLIIDMVVASILVTMGMMMLPPSQISLPFKLLLFVLIDGWTLTVGMLIDSVRLVT